MVRIHLLILSLLLSSGAAAMPILTTDGSGNVTGATGLESGGMTFSMEFVNGSCVSLFDGCDDNSDFIISGTTSTTHGDVLPSFFNAFIGGVLTDDDGSLDARPYSAIGFTPDLNGYTTWAPTATNEDPGLVNVAAMFNVVFSFDSFDGVSVVNGLNANFDFSGSGDRNFARFSLEEPVQVPDPGSLVLLALGLAGLGLRQMRKTA